MKNWEIKPNGADIIATNSVTGEVFTGTRTQLNTRLASFHRDSFSRTLVTTDLDSQLSSDSASAVTYTIPADSYLNRLSIGARVKAYQAGTGSIDFAAGAGVTLQGVKPYIAQYQSLEINYLGNNQWAYVGSDRIVAITNAANQLTGLGARGGVITPMQRCLKNFTGANTLTGGTVGLKTLLLQVPIPDGALLNYGAGIRISAFFGFTLNTNTKTFGIDIGQTFPTGVLLWSRARSSATSGADSVLTDFQRHPSSSNQCIEGYGETVAVEGASNNNVSTYTRVLGVDPAATGLSIYFWGTLNTANTDQITLARAQVDLSTGEQ